MMEERIITKAMLEAFRTHLKEEEKSDATVEKYLRDAEFFCKDNNECINKESVIAYKHRLISDGYAVRSVNSMLASLNSLFSFLGWEELKVKALKVQQQAFTSEEKELTRAEYERLCRAAERKKNKRISMILQTICSMGIRVSELTFVTVESVNRGKTVVSLKGKTRMVFMPTELQVKLKRYLREEGISNGPLFITRSGKPMNRTNIWREMKSLCKEAGVRKEKVFPHNLRHLFARIFYGIDKDLLKLADILGHSSINTTRIYISTTGTEHRRRLEQMHLIL